jgi:hypothetical protein
MIAADTESPRELLSTTVGLGARRRVTAEVYRLHVETLVIPEIDEGAQGQDEDRISEAGSTVTGTAAQR